MTSNIWIVIFKAAYTLAWNKGKWQTNYTGSYVKTVGEIRKSSTNMEENKNSDKHSTHWAGNILCARQKTNRRWFAMNSLQTLYYYTNIVFANWFTNKMFASVYEALQSLYVPNHKRTMCHQTSAQIFLNFRT